MAVKISTAAAIAACNALSDQPDVGAGPNGTLVIYEGTRPANADTAIGAQKVLVTFELANPSFGAAADAGTTANASAEPIAAVAASATGTAQFFRIFNTDGDPVFDGTVTAVGGGGDMEISSTAVVSGIDVTVVSLTAVMPKG